MTPTATYRLQFHAGFTFDQAAALADYLAKLGISHVYASPIAKARAGSTHGYDVVDPTVINPELGGEDAFCAMVSRFRAAGLGLILDIVPNHLAVGGDDNAWWLDVLEKGEASPYEEVFDIDWRPRDPALQGKLLAPFLGAPYGEALAAGDIRLATDGRGGLWAAAYDHHRFPIREADRAEVLQAGLEAYDPHDAEGRARLHQLLERQAFRLAWWRVAGDEINWRRFFDITELAGVRVERPAVFDKLHALPLRLYSEGLIDGLRIDHIDGLAEPAGYLRRLREELSALEAKRPAGTPSGPAYLVVEKILAHGEAMDRDWACDGTTGYDFMNSVAALLHDGAGEASLEALWGEISQGRPAFEAEEHSARLEMLNHGFAGQVAAVAQAFHALSRAETSCRDLTEASLRRAMVELLAHFPAYRIYGGGGALSAGDSALLAKALNGARAHVAPADRPALDQLQAWLTGEGPGPADARADALRRFHQLSAPVAAKAVEDTAFYRHLRLLSRNDVGSDPARLASTPAEFHQENVRRAAQWPAGMLTTATHDHKRGEDVRARLAVLSERPSEWEGFVRPWLSKIPDEVHPADAYQILQTLAGALPLDLEPGDEEGLKNLQERVSGWLTKALREGKLRSSWSAPDEAYEAACQACLQKLVEDKSFQGDLFRFVGEIAPSGAMKGLAQLLLRCTSPGVPDTYQGTEFWDFSLVDPDNRRPVDYEARRRGLEGSRSAGEALSAWRSGGLKQHVLQRVLHLRRERPAVFTSGVYRPIEVEGARRGQVIAFARGEGEDRIIVAAVIGGPAERSPLPQADWWSDTQLRVDADDVKALRDVLAEQDRDAPLEARQVFADLPVALLIRR